jgi:uncharacterized membrane protein
MTMTKFLALITVFGASLTAPGAYAQTSAENPATSAFHVVPTPNGHPKPFQNDLHSASGSSASDIWAVGQAAIHFNGTKWTAFSVPKIKGDNTSRLGGVVDFAPNNVWTVGIINIGLGNTNQIIEHFDGTKWSVSPGPTFLPNDEPSLQSVTAISPSDMWATGFILTNNFASLYPLFEHYDGTSWTAFETTSSSATMFGISADATNDVWAVGTVALYTTSIEHYDGNAWSVISSPNAGAGWNILEGVAALAPNNVWAVGYYTQQQNSTRPALTLIEHWDGTSWKIVASPNVGPNSQYQSNQLYGITAISANDIWAYGSYFASDGSEQQSTLVEHWNGTSWKIVPSPNPVNGTFRADILFGGTVISTGDLWLVGNEFGSTLALNATGQ